MGLRASCWLFVASLSVLANSNFQFATTKRVSLWKLTVEDGLNQSTVRAILQDRRGFMWFGTQDGLHRYDGSRIRKYLHQGEKSYTISNNRITSLYEDPQGLIWIGTDGGGLNRLDPETGIFTAYRAGEYFDGEFVLDRIWCIEGDQRGGLWIGTIGGGLLYFDSHKETWQRFVAEKTVPGSLSENHVKSLLRDSKGVLWIGTLGVGLNRYDGSNLFGRFMHDPDDVNSLSDNSVQAILEDQQGYLWIATDYGLNRFDHQSGSFQRYFHQPGEDGSLPDNFIQTLYEDQDGRLWVGTANGLCRYDRSLDKFIQFVSLEPDANASDIVSITESREGALWLGTYGDGLRRFDGHMEHFNHVSMIPGDERALPHDFVRSFSETRQDGQSVLWVGTAGGLARYDHDGQGFRVFKHDPKDPNSLPANQIWSLLTDRDGQLWIGTRSSGLSRMLGTNRFQTYTEANSQLPGNGIYTLYQGREHIWIGTTGGGLARYHVENDQFLVFANDEEQADSLSANDVRTIVEDQDGKLWVGTQFGLNRMVGSRFIRYLANRENPKAISDNVVLSSYRMRNGRLLFGTDRGLNRWLEDGSGFEHFDMDDGLPNSVIYAILEDSRGRVWISTNRGLACLDLDNREVESYGPEDGLQGLEYNAGSAFLSSSGDLYFGGTKGFNRFRPEQVMGNETPIPAVFSNVLLYNDSLELHHENPESPLDKHIFALDRVSFKSEHSLLSFEMAALFYARQTDVRFGYILEGYDNNWIVTTPNNPFATYTRLPAGDYRLKLKAGNATRWYDDIKVLKIRVTPPWWRSPWALATYVLIMALVLGRIYLRQMRRREQERSQAVRERHMLERMRQLDKLKDEFLATTSHELRTPLNGIIGLTESLRDGLAGPLNEGMRENLNLVLASARRLGTLIDDLMDLSLIKNQSIELDCKPVDLATACHVVLLFLEKEASSQGLKLYHEIPDNLPLVHADENRLQQILHNLISNGIKFTEKGEVLVRAKVVGGEVWVEVRDTGMGIEASKISRIFDFEQGDGSLTRNQGGAGIGLVITRSLINLHGGRIWVKTAVGEGSRFYFSLPIAEMPMQHRPSTSQRLSVKLDLNQSSESVGIEKPVLSTEGKRVLVVDDEMVNRRVMVNLLSLGGYEVANAASGHEALEQLRTQTFDLVLLDIMMPGISGYEVCRKIRESFSINELPVIFLTALQQDTDLEEAFQAGGNDFVSKPISREALLPRVGLHLHLLMAHRTLETRVSERTHELALRNRELIGKNEAILRTQKQLIMREKMASIGDLTSGVAHELRNPLNFINNFSALALELHDELEQLLIQVRDGFPNETRLEVADVVSDLRENLASIHRQGDKAKGVVDGIMQLTREGVTAEVQVPFNDIVEECVKMAISSYQVKGLLPNGFKLISNYDEAIDSVEGLSASFSRAVINLVNNGLDALGDSLGIVNPILNITTIATEGFVQLIVEDNGVGVNEAYRDQIFHPFFTTKGAQQNHVGLGLFVTYEIVAGENEGKIDFDSKPGATRFIVSLPKVREIHQVD